MPWTKKQKQEYNRKYNQTHPRDRRDYDKEWYRNNKDKVKDYGKEYYLNNKEQIQKYQQEYREENKDTNKLCNHRLLIDVFTHYSNGQPKCDCCGETIIEFLTIDHINGHKESDLRIKKTSPSQPYHRFISGTKLYRWLKRNNYPDGYRVLCFNCNCGRTKTPDKICPHKRLNMIVSEKPL